MSSQRTYDLISELYHRDRAWRDVNPGESREALNVAEASVGRHGDSSAVAVRIADLETGEVDTHSYATVNRAANRFANYLSKTVDPRARVGAMLEPRRELYATVFGTIQAGRIYVPLSPLFGEEALTYRLADAGVSVLVTSSDHLEALDLDELASLDRVLVVDAIPAGQPDEVRDFEQVTEYGDGFDTVRSHPDDVYAVKYTSGTTGQPKGCLATHRRLLNLHAYVKYTIDLRPDDVYFLAASPAWSYGMSVGTLSPGIFGTAIGHYRGKFAPESALEAIETMGATNVMMPPTALRQVRNADVAVEDYDLDVRVLATVGETLDAGTVEWCQDRLGVVPLDGYGLTEAGAMVVCNHAFDDWEVRTGSMGKPVPGYDVAVLDEHDEPVPQGEVGELVVRRPTVADGGYWGDPEASVETYHGQWLRTEDLVRADEDGYFWYVGRADEVIISAGYRIGPEEVEESLLQHEAVAEAAVYGVDDETRGTVVKAEVVPVAGAEPGQALRERIVDDTRTRLSKHEYPRELEFVDHIPTTESGKIRRDSLGE